MITMTLSCIVQCESQSTGFMDMQKFLPLFHSVVSGYPWV